MKTKTKTVAKTNVKTKKQKADAPMSRSEFKNAISKMTRDELIGILCDIYYIDSIDTDAKDGGCECDCGCCGSESVKSPAKAKKPVKSSKGSKKK